MVRSIGISEDSCILKMDLLFHRNQGTLLLYDNNLEFDVSIRNDNIPVVVPVYIHVETYITSLGIL